MQEPIKDIFHSFRVRRTSFKTTRPLPIKGYKAPSDFPDCCPLHRGMFKMLTEWFEEFPECCPIHKEMAKKGLKKEAYTGLPMKLMNLQSYFEYFVCQRIHLDNYLHDIDNYYTFLSWSLPNGIGVVKFQHLIDSYFEYVLRDLNDPSRERLIEVYNFLRNSNKENTDPIPDLNLLNRIYQRWLNVLPDLEEFEDFKRTKGLFPMRLTAKEAVFNPYIGLTTYKTRTEKEFLKILMDKTTVVLDKINLIEQSRNGELKEAEQKAVDLLTHEHKLSQKENLGALTTNQLLFSEVILKWLKTEIEYFDKIKHRLDVYSNESTEKDEKQELASFGDAEISTTLKDYIIKGLSLHGVKNSKGEFVKKYIQAYAVAIKESGLIPILESTHTISIILAQEFGGDFGQRCTEYPESFVNKMRKYLNKHTS